MEAMLRKGLASPGNTDMPSLASSHMLNKEPAQVAESVDRSLRLDLEECPDLADVPDDEEQVASPITSIQQPAAHEPTNAYQMHDPVANSQERRRSAQ